MTPQFKQFAVENFCANNTCNDACGHHWLRAFVRAVRDEADNLQTTVPSYTDEACLWVAFNRLCERYGLPLQ